MSTTIVLIISTIVVTLVVIIAQKYLSTRKFWQLGAIVPIVSIAIMGMLLHFKDVPISTKTILPCVILIALELFIWIDGRKTHKQNELRKMKAKDI